MHDDSRQWQRQGTFNQGTSLGQQVVFGHLLPHYQAAQEWQDTVRAQRVLQTVVAGDASPDEPALVRVRHDAMRRWRSRWWRALWGTGDAGVAVTTNRLAWLQTIAPRRPTRVSPGS
jgi:hypothetical protein